MASKMKHWVSIIGLIVSFIWVLNAQAQEETLRFNRLTVEDGLSSGFVQAVLKDKQGFMWFGTRDGLNRYDGYTIVPYNYDPLNFNSISADYIVSLAEDTEGNIWIGTYGSGLNKFDPKTETFTRYQNAEIDPTSFSGAIVETIFQDSDGTIWAGTREGGLNQFDANNKTFIHYLPEENNPNSLSGAYITAIYEDETGRLWIGTLGHGLNLFNPENKTFTRFQHDPDNPASLSNDNVTSFSPAGDGLIWVGTSGGGFNLFNPDDDTFIRYTADETDLSDNRIDALLQDGQGYLWIGTESQGLNRFDPDTEKFVLYSPDPMNSYSLTSDYIVRIYEDDQDRVWFATFGGGVNKYDPLSNRFEHYYHDPEKPTSLSDNSILSFFEDDEGIVWVGTDTGGLNHFDPVDKTITRYPFVDGDLPDETDPARLSTDTVTSITQDDAGNLWLGTWNGGLNKFNRDSETFTYYLADTNNPSAMQTNIILSLYFDTDENILWVGTVREGLSKLDLVTETFTHYLADENDPNSLTDNTISSIYKDDEGILWLTTRNGLTRFNPDTETFTQYLPDENDRTKLSHNYAWRIEEDSDGIFWITTRGGGLNKFDRETEQFTRYQRGEGLPSNTIYGVHEDDDGYLWLSTANGLARFDPSSETLITYDVKDGLQANEFGWPSLQTEDGNLLFGGQNGFNVFHPDTLSSNMYPPPVVLTDFLLSNKPIEVSPDGQLPESVHTVDHIILEPEDSAFAFEFSALGFTNSEKNQFAYRLEGLEADWNFVDSSRRFASYNSLTPGEYTFWVKASNNDGVWNDEGTAVTLTVLPAWWQTWWFRTILILGIVAVVLGAFNLRIRAINAQKRQLQIQVDEQTKDLIQAKEQAQESQHTAEVASQAKSDFLANMSHELRTPLNGILGYVQILKRDDTLDEQQNEGLNVIQQSGQHLLTLINDILDLSKIEAGKTEIVPTQFHLRSFLEGVSGIIRARAEQKQIQCIYQPDAQLPNVVYADERQLRQVLLNLLGNAVKFTDEGSVTFRVIKRERSQGDELRDNIRFEIEDTGIGMTTQQIERIFQPFEQVGDKHRRAEGTGLGLTISQNLITEMDSQIQVRSEIGQGSTFWFDLDLPINLAEASEDKETQQTIVGYKGKKQCALIVDDKAPNRSILVNLLQSLGFETIEAENGKQSVTLAKKNKPTLIVMDMIMPVMTGFEAALQIRQLPDLQETFIIALSASVLDEDKQQSILVGCDVFLSKPIDIEKFLTTLETRLNLDWIYQSLIPPKTISGVTESVSDIVAPPDEEITALLNMALSGDISGVREKASALGNQKATWGEFARHVAQLAAALEDEEIIAFLEQYQSKDAGNGA